MQSLRTSNWIHWPGVRSVVSTRWSSRRMPAYCSSTCSRCYFIDACLWSYPVILSSSSVAHGCAGTPQPHAGTPQQHAPVAATPEPTIPEALLPAPGPLSNTRLLAQASQPAGAAFAPSGQIQRRLDARVSRCLLELVQMTAQSEGALPVAETTEFI